MPRPLTLITGGTRGIGAAVARRLAAEGHDLVLGYVRDEDAATRTRAAVESFGASCRLVRADLTTDEGIDALFAEAAEVGRLTGVVNNAGATLHIGPLAQTPSDVIRRVIDLNLTSAVLVARRAVAELTQGGVLVNISSGAATTGSPGEYVHYAAAKAGVDALTKGSRSRRRIAASAWSASRPAPSTPTSTPTRAMPVAWRASRPLIRWAAPAGPRRSPASWLSRSRQTPRT